VKPVRPADVTVVLAAAKATNFGGWTSADGVAVYLSKLGFATTAQQASGYLRRICRLDCPPIVMRIDHWYARSWTEFRVTGFGRLWISNILAIRLEGQFPHPSEIEGER